MKKILFLIHDLDQGGAEKVLVNLANNLDKTKYDVTIQTLFDVGVNRKYINDDVHYVGGLKWRFRGNSKIFRALPSKILSKIFIKNKYDVVIAFLEGPDTRIVSAYNGKKVAWVHIDFSSVDMLTKQYKSFEEMCNCYNSFDRIVCVADTVKQKFTSFFDVKPECITLYNVNDTDNIIKKGKENQGIINKSNTCINIVSVGRLINDHKAFDRLINIHKRLCDNGIKNNLFILGEGPDHNKLQSQIDELGLNDMCKLLGFDENPYKYVSKADLFICSSNREGFSTAVTESLVLGVPVVSTDVSGARELLGNNNEYGIVTEINEDALYEGVHKMLTEDGLLAHYKKQAEIRGKEFSTEKTTKAVEEMLESL